jgi:aryl-phospho-beta-D-glucosidase BglC (GH1 family)
MHRMARTFIAAALLAGSAGAVTACGSSSNSSLSSAKSAQSSKAAALTKLHATATEAFVRSDGTALKVNGPNLQPVWDANDSSQTWGQGTYTAIKAKGFTGIRMVLFWDDFEPSKGRWNETAFSTLKTALARAKSAGLYVVLDCVHLYGQPEGQGRVPAWARTTDGMGAVAKNGLPFLQQLATRFGKDPALAAYDPVNEPYRWPVNHKTVLADYTKIVNAIRAKDASTNIALEPTYGDAKVPTSAFSSFTPTKRTNLLWSVHDYYSGNKGLGFDANGIGTSPNPSDGETGYTASTGKANMAKHLQVHLDMAKAEKLPVWIGEFGVGAGATGHDAYIKDKVALYKSKGLGYSWWEYSDDGTFAMVNKDDDSWKPWAGWVK